MKNLVNILFIITLASCTIGCSQDELTCVLTGEFVGQDSDTLILTKATEDPRSSQTMISVNNGRFNYTLTTPFTEAYTLILKSEFDSGAWRQFYFFPYNGITEFKLYQRQVNSKSEIKGGKLTSEYYDYQESYNETFRSKYQAIQDSILLLINKNKYYTTEYLEIQAEVHRAKNSDTLVRLTQKLQRMTDSGDFATPEGKLLNEKWDSINNTAKIWRYNYIADNPSLVSYYFLIEDMKNLEYFKNFSIDDIKEKVPVFFEKYPNHSYTEIMKVLFESEEQVQVGGNYIDFSLPDLDGKIYTLSEIINGKYAVIDLWASWCGPCILGSRELIPLYEEFHEKGFTVCGIANEFKDTDELKNLLEKEKFPWINLVELDGKTQIWLKYGVPGAGRKIFVDDNGTILSIDPEIEQIREILNEKIN